MFIQIYIGRHRYNSTRTQLSLRRLRLGNDVPRKIGTGEQINIEGEVDTLYTEGGG